MSRGLVYVGIAGVFGLLGALAAVAYIWHLDRRDALEHRDVMS